MPSLFVEHWLPNRLRIVCEAMPGVRSAAVGFCVRTGARDESPNLHGVSHFLEHMCFKGTAKRDWRAINVGFDELGSIYNAFTGKQHTVYYGWVPAERTEAQIELLADMLRPSLPPADFETERNVILEEIAMSGDSFEHQVSDFLHHTVFGTHPLAHEILGEKETIAGLPRDAMAAYHRARYSAANCFFLAAGAIDPQVVQAAVGRYCGPWERHANGQALRPPVPPLPSGVRRLKLDQFKQQTLVLLYPGVPHGHRAEESIESFTSLFGGKNSRCYWNIIQKGICQQAGAVWLAYEDCGLMALYADGEPERCAEMLAALRAEVAAVMKRGFREDEVQRVKNQRRTQLALEAENPRTRFMQLLDDVEVFDRPRTTAARLAAVEAVSRDSINAYLHEFPIHGEGLLLSVGPRDWP